MNLIEPFLRGAGIAMVVLLFLVIAVRGGWRLRIDLLLMLSCVAAYLACSSPALLCGAEPGALPLVLAALAFPFVFWRLASVVLEDDRHIPWLAWTAAAVMVTCGLLAVLDYLPVPPNWRPVSGGLSKLMAIGFLGSAGVRAWRSREGDLIDARRRLRWIVVGALGFYSLAVIMVEIYLQRAAPPPWLDLLNISLIDLALLANAVLLLDMRPQAQEALFKPAPVSSKAAEADPLPAAMVDADAVLIDRLAILMRDQHLYRDPELSVKSLASALEVPEYVLRRLILARLGHRHFATFVNDYRLQEVTARMADPALNRRPILTLALEAGFGSIGPFNRFFRERYGMTPSEFRERCMLGPVTLESSPGQT
ncbi:helix-turn-helix transcriptional regulator [Rhodoferax sp.]|uniref:helix-turn-helix transcriptional regulator n=1 Tax=Rhodoferax sp. TaxID=50421 RepID=UPI00273051D6|nr:helix-turn-helix transcriptional regulator [Rhodoferax sp.]MDP1942979.1 helix-turn-helix transcriptional regulator [Rhodoferax sp.]MDP3751957.1 helix-turn-helix transcriptional regulator [Polaromonas sp.]